MRVIDLVPQVSSLADVAALRRDLERTLADLARAERRAEDALDRMRTERAARRERDRIIARLRDTVARQADLIGKTPPSMLHLFGDPLEDRG
jgi:hypothetical protein